MSGWGAVAVGYAVIGVTWAGLVWRALRRRG